MRTVILTYGSVDGYPKGTHHDGLVTVLDKCRQYYSDVPAESLKDFARVVIYLGDGHPAYAPKDLILRLRSEGKQVVLSTCRCSSKRGAHPTPGLYGFLHRWVDCGGRAGLREMIDQIIDGDF